MAELDRLEVVIETQASKANEQLEKLANKLEKVSNTLGGVNESNLTSLVNGISNISSASTQLEKFTLSTGRATKSTKSFTQNVSSLLGKFYIFTKGIRKACGAIWSATESSMDFLETVNYFEVAMRKLGDDAAANWEQAGYESAEAYAKSFSERAKQLTQKMTGYDVDEDGNTTYAGVKNLGMNPDSVMNYQAMFAQVSESIGVAEESALNFSTALTMLGADWASLRNTTFEQAWEKFASALAGQSRAVRAFGIDITNATLQEYAYKYGLTTAIAEMNQATKAQLRLLAILDQSEVAFGDLANTMQSPSNQLRMLRQNFSNLARTIGNLFLPIVEKVLPYINGLVMALQRLFTWIGSLLGIKFNSINSSIGGMDNGIEDLVDGADDAEDSLNGANDAAKKLKNTILGFDEINQLNDNTDSSSGGSGSGGGIGGGSPLLDEEIANALAEYQEAWDEAFDRMENKAQDIADRICKAFKRGDYEGIGRYISNGITKGLESINWNSVYSVFKNFGKGFAEFLNGLISPSLFGAVGKTIASALNTAVYTSLSFGATFDWSNLGTSIAEGVNKFFATFDFASLAETINVWVQGLFTTLTTEISKINWWEVYKGINDFLNNLDISTVAIIIGALTIKKIGSVILKEGLITWLGNTLSKLITNVPIILSNIKILSGGGLVEETGFFTKLADAFALSVGGAGTLHEALVATFGTISTMIAGIASVIGGAITAVVNFFAMWEDGFSWLNEALMVLGIAIAAVGAVILGVPAGIAAIVAGIVAAIATVVIVIKDHWEEICDFFQGMWESICGIWSQVTEWFNTNVIQPVVGFFQGLWESVSGFFSQLWEDISRVWSAVSGWFSENVIEPVVGFFQGLWTRVQQIFEGLWIIVQAIWQIVSTWFDENVIQPVVGFFQGLWESVSGFFSQLWEDISETWDDVAAWFDENVIHPIIKFFCGVWENVSEYFSKLWKDIQGVWSVVSGWFDRNIAQPIKKIFDDVTDSIATAFSGAWISVKSGVVSAMNSVIGGIESAINWIIKGINKVISGFNDVVSWAADVIGQDWGGVSLVNEVSLGRISMYANGGFPETGELFMARENGINEMIGKIGNRSAVANNDQIVEGIQSGVETAMMNVMMAFVGQNSNSASEPIIENVVKIDSETLYKMTQKGKEKHDRRYHVVTEI